MSWPLPDPPSTAWPPPGTRASTSSISTALRPATVPRSALLRPLVREVARLPELRVEWTRGEIEARGRDAAGFADVLARTPRLGLPGSDFIFPTVHQVDAGGQAHDVIAGSLPPDLAAAGDAILRVAATSMIQDDATYAPYGWSHCLTLPQSVLGIIPWVESPTAATAIAATYVVAFRAAQSSRDIDMDRPPERTRVGARDAIDADPETAASAVFHASDAERAAIIPELAARAAVHEDAHLAKYTLACFDAADRRPVATQASTSPPPRTSAPGGRPGVSQPVAESRPGDSRRPRRLARDLGEHRQPPETPNSAVSSDRLDGAVHRALGHERVRQVPVHDRPQRSARASHPTSAARCRPLTNARFEPAVEHQRRARAAASPATRSAPAIDVSRGRVLLGREPVQERRDLAVVAGRGDAAEHGDAECGAELTRRRRSSPSRRRPGAAGTADMIDAVIGDIVSAMPADERDDAQHARTRTAVCRPSRGTAAARARSRRACRTRPSGARRTGR